MSTAQLADAPADEQVEQSESPLLLTVDVSAAVAYVKFRRLCLGIGAIAMIVAFVERSPGLAVGMSIACCGLYFPNKWLLLGVGALFACVGLYVSVAWLVLLGQVRVDEWDIGRGVVRILVSLIFLWLCVRIPFRFSGRQWHLIQ